MEHMKKKRRHYRLCCLLTGCLLSVSAFAFGYGEQPSPYTPYFQAKEEQQTSYERNASTRDLWSVITRSFSLPHYSNTPAVQAQISWFMSHKEFLAKVANQAEPYLYYVFQQVKAQQLPGELALLPMIESAYDPFAYSPVGAAGLWQLMPSTASGLGLHQDYWFDGRKDIINSTNAALKHLSYLKDFFHDNWLLAIASYDSGEGTVLNAVKRNQQSGLSTKFWSLSLPRETETYVPRLLALAEIISNPQKYPLDLPTIRNKPYFGTVEIDHQVALSNVAKQADIKLDDLYQLNPGYSRWATDPDVHAPSRIVLPIAKIATYQKAAHQTLAVHIEGSPSPTTVQWRHYAVRSGDTLASLSKKYEVSVDDLISKNHLTRTALKTHQNLLLPKEVSEPTTATQLAQQQVKVAAPPHYKVKSGDTLDKIAKRNHTSVGKLLALNELTKQSKLHPGQALILPTSVA